MAVAALVTGCSSGIGRAAALRLAARGLTVYATARRPESLTDLAEHGCRLLALDVTDESSMAAAVEAVEAEHGHVGVLVNNAGYGQHGPVETVSMEDARRQFDTNVFGLARLCQLVLPGMRTAGGGRIVNVSSMGGRFTFPAGGWYHASKHALEALSDALRFETAGFGVRVAVVEPGLIRTGFGDTAAEAMGQASEDGTPYGNFEARAERTMAWAYRSPFARGVEPVARAIEHAATASRPRTRYRVTLGARAMVVTRRLLPDRAWDLALRTAFSRPGTRR